MNTTLEQVDLSISGMTCGACAMKVEKSLNSLDGVSATVNFATETARVTLHDDVTTEQLVAQVEKAGYGARLVADTTPEMLDKETNERVAMLRARLTVSLVAGVPVTALSMIPALHFAGWQWWALALSLPVAGWGAAPFHRAAWMNARHRATTMDTLISIGIIAAMG